MHSERLSCLHSAGVLVMSGCGRLEAWVAGSDGGHQDGGGDVGRQNGGGGSGGGR